MTRRLIPEYLDKLKAYQAGKPIEELAREKGLTKISKLASNENPLGPSPQAMKEITQKLWDIHRYPDMNAIELKSELAKRYDLEHKNIILGNGSEGIMAYIARAFMQPGDEVLTSEKTFLGFHILATSAGVKLVTVPRTKDMRYNIEGLAKAVNENTKVLYIANPDNPTGTYIKREEFDYLMNYVPKHTIVILDEAYFEYAMDLDDYPDSMSYRYDNAITLRTFSKAYGIAGVRMGYGFGHPDFIEALHKVKLPFEPNLLAQRAAIGALRDQDHLQRSLRSNKKRSDETYQYLTNKGFTPLPTQTNFMTFQTHSEEASDYIFNALLNRGVIIRPLKANKLEKWLRVSIGLKAEMQHFYEAMDEILPKYEKLFGHPSTIEQIYNIDKRD